MKRAAQTALCLLALFTLASNAHAILRPRFPQQAAPPDSVIEIKSKPSVPPTQKPE
jgi:hypothetical protein